MEFKPKKQDKEVISYRIDSDFLKLIDEKAQSAQISRNEFITQAIMFAIENMGDGPDNKNNQ